MEMYPWTQKCWNFIQTDEVYLLQLTTHMEITQPESLILKITSFTSEQWLVQSKILCIVLLMIKNTQSV